MSPQNGLASNNLNGDHDIERNAHIYKNTIVENNYTAIPINTVNTIKPPGLRMMAEISGGSSMNFNRTILSISNKQPAGEHTMKLSHVQPSSLTNSTSSLNSVSSVKSSVHEFNKTSLYKQENSKDAIAKMQYKNSNDFETNTNGNKGAHLTMNSVNQLEDIISIKDVDKLAHFEMDQILSPLLNIDSGIGITRFGSVTYGFGGTSTNFN